MKKDVLILAGIVVFLFLIRKKKTTETMPTEPIERAELKDAIEFNKMMKEYGIKNRYARWAIMCIIGKESGFEPVTEKCYTNTSASRIKSIFPTRLGGKTDSFINTLKKDCKAFFNYVYGSAGNDLGNIPNTNDGYTYRGRSLNQITGRGNYQYFGDKIGVNLISNPEKLNEYPNYFLVTILFFIDTALSSSGKSTLKNRLGINTINDFTEIDGAIRFFANCNAGIGKSWNSNVVNWATDNAKKQKNKYKLLSL
jgi:putative chitinase